MSQQTNVAKITRFPGMTTCKKLNITYLFIYQTSRSFAVVITSWNFFAQSTNTLKVDLLQQQNYFEFWEMPPAAQDDWIGEDQDYHMQKSALI